MKSKEIHLHNGEEDGSIEVEKILEIGPVSDRRLTDKMRHLLIILKVCLR